MREEFAVGCLLMAAGNAERFGENKLLCAAIDGRTLIEHALDENGGKLQFSYTLDSGAETLISRNSVLITVEPLKKQETEVE